MVILWGPELVKIYNDGYRRLLGPTKHPWALGTPAEKVWQEIWPTVAPRFEVVQKTGRATWSEHERLVIDRRGFPEECFFTYSYSPLRGPGGDVDGVLDVTVETTAEVVTTRRMACVAELSRAMAETDHVVDGCEAAMRTLSRWTDDIVAADILLKIGDHVVRAASNRSGQIPVGDAVRRVLEGGTPIAIGGDGSHGSPIDHYVAHIGTDSNGVEGVLVLTLSSLRPFDAGYRQFVDVVASTIGNDLDRTRRRNDTLGEQRHISETLQAAMLRPASDLPTVAARYVPASDDMFVGGDWYDVVDLPSERRGIVVGDCVGHGLVAATAMSQLRSAARALLLDGRGPAEVVSGLDVFAESVPEAMCTTVVCAIFDRSEESMTYCRAGHLPPLIVGKDGVRWLDAAGGTPLGIDPTQERTSATTELDQDDLILMFTDGLVERRGEIIDEGLGRLAGVATEMTEFDAQGVADGVLGKMVAHTPSDDVVLVVKRLRPTPLREAAG
jgi:hypothetical protein